MKKKEIKTRDHSERSLPASELRHSKKDLAMKFDRLLLPSLLYILAGVATAQTILEPGPSRAFSINNSGVIAGSASNSDGRIVAFTLKNDKLGYSDEEVRPNGLPEIKFSNNDRGDVVGSKSERDRYRAYALATRTRIRTPVIARSGIRRGIFDQQRRSNGT